ncbi:hypothetical protein KGY77_11555, partial [Candidatus Bipolaricaulota bacterium]|nr:hypothetical protein [Candidatus Bipolaricaulota bacterium]
MVETFKFSLKDINPILSVVLLSFAFAVAPGKGVLAKETIDFSGYTWKVKHYVRYTVGPGPNYWSSSARNVRADESGNLHLKVIENKGRWYSSEVWLDQVLGYGTYEFTVDLPELPLNKNLVLGLFNYLDDGEEFDIEITSWGKNSPTSVQFVVQPSELDKNMKRFPLDKTEETKKVFSYTWTSNELVFRCEDCRNEDCNDRVLQEEWKYRGESLPEGDLKPHINLWLVEGEPPTDGEEVEITIENFTFSPLGEEN